MTYRGQVKDGVVVLDGNPALEEGAVVRVEVVERSTQEPTHVRGGIKPPGRLHRRYHVGTKVLEVVLPLVQCSDLPRINIEADHRKAGLVERV
jgi:hypothetical protein